MSLTPAEQAAARVFRAAQRDVLKQKNASEPPGVTVSVFIRHYRHDCTRQGGKSVNLELREHYVFSPQYWVCYCSAVDQMKPEVFPHRDCDGSRVASEAGRFGFIYTEGRCAACGMTARSGSGRLVGPVDRPPGPRAAVIGITGHEDLRGCRSGQRGPAAQRQLDGAGGIEHRGGVHRR